MIIDYNNTQVRQRIHHSILLGTQKNHIPKPLFEVSLEVMELSFGKWNIKSMKTASSQWAFKNIVCAAFAPFPPSMAP